VGSAAGALCGGRYADRSRLAHRGPLSLAMCASSSGALLHHARCCLGILSPMQLPEPVARSARRSRNLSWQRTCSSSPPLDVSLPQYSSSPAALSQFTTNENASLNLKREAAVQPR